METYLKTQSIIVFFFLSLLLSCGNGNDISENIKPELPGALNSIFLPDDDSYAVPYPDKTVAPASSEGVPLNPINLRAGFYYSMRTLVVSLAWDFQISNTSTNYMLLERADGASTHYNEIARINAYSDSFIDDTVHSENFYTYRINACNRNGCSSYSNEVSVNLPRTFYSPKDKGSIWLGDEKTPAGSLDTMYLQNSSLGIAASEVRAYNKFDLGSIDITKLRTAKLDLSIVALNCWFIGSLNYPIIKLYKIDDYGTLGPEDWDLPRTFIADLNVYLDPAKFYTYDVKIDILNYIESNTNAFTFVVPPGQEDFCLYIVFSSYVLLEW